MQKKLEVCCELCDRISALIFINFPQCPPQALSSSLRPLRAAKLTSDCKRYGFFCSILKIFPTYKGKFRHFWATNTRTLKSSDYLPILLVWNLQHLLNNFHIVYFTWSAFQREFRNSLRVRTLSSDNGDLKFVTTSPAVEKDLSASEVVYLQN